MTNHPRSRGVRTLIELVQGVAAPRAGRLVVRSASVVLRSRKTFDFDRFHRQREGKVRPLPQCEYGVDTDQIDRAAENARLVIWSVLADSKKYSLEERHWSKSVPSAVRLAEHIVSG